jgi:hypothetical protein
METIRQRYAWLYWKAIRMARVPLGSGYSEVDTIADSVLN